MIYVDTSVALAHLLAEDRHPPDSLWSEILVSSRLLEYELWVRIYARKLGESHGELARQLLGRLSFVELTSQALARALEPFPDPVRTLDALHISSIVFLRSQGQTVQLASYDQRMTAAAEALGIVLFNLS